MECGKLTAKLRDAVPVCFMVNDHEVKRYKNIEIPEEIKHLEYCGFQFCVPEDGGAITFKIWFNEGILPEIWPATRERQHRAKKEEQNPTMELQYGVTGADRKTLVAAMSKIMGLIPGILECLHRRIRLASMRFLRTAHSQDRRARQLSKHWPPRGSKRSKKGKNK